MLGGASEAEPFGARLRYLRERAGLTQEELASRAGLTPHAVSALERGVRTRPYPHTVRALAGALGASDEERAALVAAVPRRGRRAEPATTGGRIAAAAPSLAGLVVPPTRLFGREADVAAVVGVVRGRTARLVTLTGPGGVGKTRLVAAVATQLAADFPDGVVEVPLAPLAEPAGVVPAIALALGLVGGDSPDALPTVVDHLQARSLLLVLDNFEHLLDAAGDVGLLAGSCPAVTVLVTSRAPLRVRGEHEHPVAPLDLPGDGVRTLEQLEASPAGALLLDRAAAVARLPASVDEVRALVEVCRRLSGLPLAIELVTARLRLLGPTTLLDRLEEVTAAASARDLPARQRTVRATLDWSYGLLRQPEQALFRVLGAFRAGATLDAVDAVAAAAASSGTPVLESLTALVEHSLVGVRAGSAGAVRYEMLEPVAQYARSLLTGEEAARARRAHAAHYVGLAERAAVGYERDEQVRWLARTEAEEANLLVAVDRCLADGDGSTAGRIAWSMWLYWWLRGQVTAGGTTVRRCLAAEPPEPVRARLLLASASLAFAAGDYPASQASWVQARRLGEVLGDAEVGAKAVAGTGLVAMATGDLPAAAERFRSALARTGEAGEAGVWLRSLAHVWLGTVLLHRGDPVAAVAETERGLLLARDRGDRLSTYVALYNLSQAAVAGGLHAEARAHLEEGLRLSEQTQDMANLAYFLDTLAVVEAADREAERVATLLGAAQSIRETVGSNVYGYYLPDLAARDAAAETARGTLGADRYEDALDRGRGLDPTDVITLALRR